MKKYITAALLMLSVMSGAAQTLTSSYFMSRMPQRHKLNPALVNDHGYFSVPMLGNINIGAGSNMGIATFLYPSATDPNMLNTFLHPDVSSADFEKRISDVNSVNTALDLSILSMGFLGDRVYTTFDVSLRHTADVSVAGDVFRFLKYGFGSEGRTYDLSNFGVFSNNYVEVSLGQARAISEKVTIGYKFKYLAGIAAADYKLDDMQATFSKDQWHMSGQGEGNLYFAGLSYTGEDTRSSDTSTGEQSPESEEFAFPLELDMSKMGLAGSGFAVDLGVTYEPFEWLQASVAVLDLGFINWNSNATSHFASKGGEFNFSGMEDLDINSEEFSFDDQLDGMKNDMMNILMPEYQGTGDGKHTKLTTTINAGLELSDPLGIGSLGVLYTAKVMPLATRHSVMGAANLRLLKFLQLTATYTRSTYRNGYGLVFNFCPKGLNIFVGTDYGVPTFATSPIAAITEMGATGEINPMAFIPVDEQLGLNLNMGLSFTFGTNRFKETMIARRAAREGADLDVYNPDPTFGVNPVEVESKSVEEVENEGNATIDEMIK